ncbi:MAG: hypothetical protein Q7S87_10090 [Agitococcus sp.]|nr:hypothetical protein [Agitococcus sp.]
MNLSDFDYLFLQRNSTIPTYLYPLTDCSHFVTEEHFNVMALPVQNEPGDSVEVGKLSYQFINLAAGINKGVCSFDIMDSVSQDLAEIQDIMIDDESAFYKEEFLDAIHSDSGALNLIYISDDEPLSSEWGPAAVHLLLEHKTDIGFAIVGVSNLFESASTSEQQTAQKRCEILRLMGFVQYKDSPYFFLDCSLQLADLPAKYLVGA